MFNKGSKYPDNLYLTFIFDLNNDDKVLLIKALFKNVIMVTLIKKFFQKLIEKKF